MSRKRRAYLKGLATAGTALVAGCSGNDTGEQTATETTTDTQTPTGATETTTAPEMTDLKVGSVVGTATTSLHIGQDQGIFNDHQVSVDINGYVTPDEVNRVYQIGEMPNVFGGLPGSLGRAHISGTPSRITGPTYYPTINMVASADVESMWDLEGEPIGVLGPGTSNDFVLEVIYQEEEGVSYREYHNAKNLAPPVIVQQLKQGNIKAGVTWPPYSADLLTSEDFHIVMSLGQAYKDRTGHNLVQGANGVQTEYLQENRAALQRFYDASREAASLINENPQVLVDSGYLENELEVTDSQKQEFMKQAWSGTFVEEYDAQTFTEDVMFYLETHQELGYMDEVPDEEIVEPM